MVGVPLITQVKSGDFKFCFYKKLNKLDQSTREGETGGVFGILSQHKIYLTTSEYLPGCSGKWENKAKRFSGYFRSLLLNSLSLDILETKDHD